MIAAILLLAAVVPVRAAVPPPRVLVARWDGPITPVSAEFVDAAIREAAQRRDDALVLELDTPGGLDTAMRESVKAILASPVPVIVHVAPAGARAASAGVFLTMAAHVAAMTPGTNIGAAHPVLLGGSSRASGEDAKPDPTMEIKLANDASAYLAAIAARRGRNADWARFVVHQSSSLPSGEAVRLRIVDFEADGLEELLAKADGRVLTDFGGDTSSRDRSVGRKFVLHTKGALIERFEPTRRQRMLKAVADPNVAMILMTLGVSGLLIEMYHPGLVLPGVVGVVALILAFYSLQTLSASFAGVLLIAAGLLFLLLELKVHGYGLLALAGLASVLFGVTMTFENAGLAVSWRLLAALLGGFVVFFGALFYVVAQALSGGARSGPDAMIGLEVTSATELSPRGKAAYGGELWRAESLDGTHPAGAALLVAGVRGLTLLVRKR